MKMSKVMVMDHPLIQHKIGLIRKKETGTYTMQPDEVAGWNRSLILRGINLPNRCIKVFEHQLFFRGSKHID